MFIAGLLVTTQLPVAAAVLLVFLNPGTEHQMLVSADGGRTKVTLHHTTAPEGVHHHTGWESMLLCGTDGGHPDHEFAFGCGETAEGAKPKTDGVETPASWMADPWDTLVAPGHDPGSAASPHHPCGAFLRTPEPPMVLRRGVVLLV